MATTLARADEIMVAAAADLSLCLPQIDKAFQSAHPGAVVKAAFGSSGNFVAQIESGAPFDVFLSADINYPRQLVRQGFADDSSIAVYARGQIVLWSAAEDLPMSRGFAVLRDPAIKRFAIANPDHAPYGRAAKAALEKAGLWDLVQPKLVTGENVSQAAQFILTGNAGAGIVALSLLRAPGMENLKNSWLIPAADYPPIEQAAVITKAGAGNGLARAYVDFLSSGEAQKILVQYGFELPGHR